MEDMDFCMLIQVPKNSKNLSKTFWIGMVKLGVASLVKKGCGQSGHGTLTLAVSEKRTDGIK